jgi:hypothetical protein
MNEQEFVLSMLDWLKEKFDEPRYFELRSDLLDSIEAIVQTAVCEDVFPAFKPDKQ